MILLFFDFLGLLAFCLLLYIASRATRLTPSTGPAPGAGEVYSRRAIEVLVHLGFTPEDCPPQILAQVVAKFPANSPVANLPAGSIRSRKP